MLNVASCKNFLCANIREEMQIFTGFDLLVENIMTFLVKVHCQ